MKAVFITRDCLLVTGGSTDHSAETALLRAGVAQSLRRLVDQRFLVVLLDPTARGAVSTQPSDVQTDLMTRLLAELRHGGGMVHALLTCPHAPEDACGCWDTSPGFLYAAATELDLRLDECYVFGTQSIDAHLAQRMGCRPLLVLNEHSIAELYDGHQPDTPDFPVARDLSAAVQYLLCEEEANEVWGYVRQPALLSDQEEEAHIPEAAQYAPQLKLFAPLPSRRSALLAGIPPISHRARQALAVYILGGIWLSLGIAYLLTHLYRVQHFPAFVWYLTLQFIPRPVRGLLFIMTGIVLVVVSLRALMRIVPGSAEKG